MGDTAQFFDLPLADFPFTIEFLDEETGKVVWEQYVEEPGALLVPSKYTINEGRSVLVRLTYPDGEVMQR